MVKVILSTVVLVAVGVVALRRPEIIARFMTSSARYSPGSRNLTKTEEMARSIREDGLEWRSRYPELHRFIVGIGYVAFGFCLVLWLVFLMSVPFE